MFTVALIGPDGAGKTTVSRQVIARSEFPMKSIYMGVNHEACEHLLPTTRAVMYIKRKLGRHRYAGGPREKNSPKSKAKGLKALRRNVKSTLSLANRLAEQWYRQAIVWLNLRRGYVVLFDRHFFSDYYAYDIRSDVHRTWNQRLHGYLLDRYYPKPDLVIYLDAPASVLFARKQEGSLELLEQRRQDYLEMGQIVNHFEVVDANRDVENVVADVAELIETFHRQRSQPTERVKA